jgi:hypothetical protein
LEALYPGNKTVRGAEQARTVTAALALTEQQMEGVKTIRVIGETNARSSSRR